MEEFKQQGAYRKLVGWGFFGFFFVGFLYEFFFLYVDEFLVQAQGKGNVMKQKTLMSKWKEK